MNGTLPNLFDAGDERSPAVVDLSGAVLSYGALKEQSTRLALALVAAGVRVGERVAYQVEKSPSTIIVHLALLRCGAIQVPINSDYSDQEARALLDDAEPVMVIRSIDRGMLPGPWQSLSIASDGTGSLWGLPWAADTRLPQIAAADGAALLYTSGTTGRPKGALLSHANLVANARTLVDVWGFASSDVLLHILPLFHTHGLFVATHCVLASGSSMVLLPRFEVDPVLQALPSCSVMMGVPTHYTRLLADERFGAVHCEGVRLFISGSAPMTAAVHADFTSRTGAEILERYGMTETSMLASNPLEGPRRAGTVGPPLPDVSIRVVDDDDQLLPEGRVGQVEVRGPNVFAGYWRRPDLQPESFTVDGWFRTGDVGQFDDDGYLELVGRSKDVVITGGLNVYPKEVELVLDSLPGVRESAVIGLPDDDLGEVVVGVVVGESDAPLDGDELRGVARRHLAGYKTPKRIVVVPSLPRNVMGKVQKSLLRDQMIDLGR
ncbi:MAG: AMP-binding protein [Actinomycetes bacterium]